MARHARNRPKPSAGKKAGQGPARTQASGWKKAVGIAVGVAIAAVIATLAVLFWAYDVSIVKYDMHLTVSTVLAFKVDADALWFGGVPPAGSSMRTITLRNANNQDRLASLYFFGDLAKWVSTGADPLRMVLGPGESRVVTLTASVPEDAPFGPVDGWLLIVFRKS